MAAGLGFKTFTTGEVLTAADTNGYLMQGVLVFASSAARAAAITSPQEGQYSYLKDTNSTEYYDGAAWIAAPIGDITGVTAGTGISGGGTSGTVTITNSMATAIDAKGDLVAGTGADAFSRLGVGADNTVLTADSAEATGLKWATPAGGGGMTLINTFSMSAVSSLNMNSIFSATYSRYRILIYTTQSVAAWINLRLRVSGSDNTTSNYFGSEIQRTGGANTGADAVATTGWSKFMFAGQKLSTISFDIMNPFSSSLNTVASGTFGAQETTNVEIVVGTSYGLFNADTSFDGLSLISTGTMTGQVKVYGYPE
jgi:hypothetical protein